MACLVEEDVAAISNEFASWAWERAGKLTGNDDHRYALAATATYALAAMVLRRVTDVTGGLDVVQLVSMIENVQVVDPGEN
ncbi:MAG TPA: hypothetical protein VFH61_16175 [Thermoleophilia bacterium]|nr:hypothetical protein [Thermoleophilia bacterium]